jgi:hypothetical protein
MIKKPLPLTANLEGRFESFAPLRRDFNVAVENKSSEKLVAGVISAQWADVTKPGEKAMVSGDATQHAFGPAPSKLILYIESEESYWGATLDVEGLNGAKFTLLGVM